MDTDTLAGSLLIAMPGMGDPRFAKSVVYICAHSDEGAMGLIINKPAPGIKLRSLLEQLEVPFEGTTPTPPVYFGGPVEHGRGFVLHSMDYGDNDSTLQVTKSVGMTATLDVLEHIAQGQGPDQFLLALGYAGWGPGQLEQELQQNGWLTVAATDDLVFSADNTAKWEEALARLGINPLVLSAEGGSA